MKNKSQFFFAAILMTSSLVFFTGCVLSAKNYSQNESAIISEDFLKNSLLYYNARNIALIESAQLNCDKCYVNIFSFQADNLFNKSKGEVHYADLIVSKGRVAQAIVDNSWDLVSNKLVSELQSERGSNIFLYFCPELRKKECEMISEPVCSSERKDYMNGCFACMESTVKWYSKGLCSLGYFDKVVKDINQGKVSSKSIILLYFIVN